MACAGPEAPELLLAKTWDESLDPTDWWISEKYDGVRGFWDGRSLRFRSGGPIHAPKEFLAHLPAGVALDGELWMGRGRFEEVSGTVRRQTPDSRWAQVKFMVFDAPGAEGTFERRTAYLQKLLGGRKGPVQLVRQWRCRGRAHLLAERDRMVEAGGEGLMIREPESAYEGRRSGTLLKVKTHEDAEAVVIGYKPGRGKFEGMVGSLRVRSEDGREFSVGSGLTLELWKKPPAVGSVITYRFRGLTKNGLPRFPTFWRKRSDAPVP